jgi:hypothetical protein
LGGAGNLLPVPEGEDRWKRLFQSVERVPGRTARLPAKCGDSGRGRAPTEYRDQLLVLAVHKILPEEQLPTFQNMASVRNLFVHRYENMDGELVFGIFKKRLGDFDFFISPITDWAGEKSAKD